MAFTKKGAPPPPAKVASQAPVAVSTLAILMLLRLPHEVNTPPRYRALPFKAILITLLLVPAAALNAKSGSSVASENLAMLLAADPRYVLKLPPAITCDPAAASVYTVSLPPVG